MWHVCCYLEFLFVALSLGCCLLAYRRRLSIWFESEVSSEEVPQMPEVGHAVPCKLSNAQTAANHRANKLKVRGAGSLVS